MATPPSTIAAPIKGGPLGEGQLDGQWLICPWHGYEYDPQTGHPPEGYGDYATPLGLEVREDGVYVEVEEPEHEPTVSDQMVAVMTAWGVDVGNNTYSFGRFFECKANQSVLMSGYLGSIGFAFPAALGAWAAVGDQRKIVSISGDGGFGQYLAEFTTAVKYGMPICHILLNNDQLGKISKEQRASHYHVWQTSLQNPNFSEYAKLCGGLGIRVTQPGEMAAAIRAGLEADGPAIVEILTDPMQT